MRQHISVVDKYGTVHNYNRKFDNGGRFLIYIFTKCIHKRMVKGEYIKKEFKDKTKHWEICDMSNSDVDQLVTKLSSSFDISPFKFLHIKHRKGNNGIRLLKHEIINNFATKINSKRIYNFFKKQTMRQKSNKMSVLDCTGGFGGIASILPLIFTETTICEIEFQRSEFIKKLFNVYEYTNPYKIHNINSLEYVKTNKPHVDVLFIDVPWSIMGLIGIDGDIVKIRDIITHMKIYVKGLKKIIFHLPVNKKYYTKRDKCVDHFLKHYNSFIFKVSNSTQLLTIHTSYET